LCGIFGMVGRAGQFKQREHIKALVERLFILSETRGKEASGCAIWARGAVHVYKSPERASRMIRSQAFADFFAASCRNIDLSHDTFCIIGHSRLVTNGSQIVAANNQPVTRDGLVAIHNGIIVNAEDLWKRHPELHRTCDVDTEVLLALMANRRHAGDDRDISAVLADSLAEIRGTAAVAVIEPTTHSLVLATNNGSLYKWANLDGSLFVFASERPILSAFVEENIRSGASASKILEDVVPTLAQEGTVVNLDDAKRYDIRLVDLRASVERKAHPSPRATDNLAVINYVEREDAARLKLRRCTRCILPSTMPFIAFDSDGVCNYCHTYEPIVYKGHAALESAIIPYRKRSVKPECLIGVSGGRDSCYGLHVAVREFGLKPLAYTYDWGMVTDLARRNTARLCGELGVEHILVSADVTTKRRYIRKNLEAWLKRPSLGMIPLLMAGDKPYFYYANKVSKENDVALSVLCENKLERAHFKNGFAGVESTKRVFEVGIKRKLQLMSFYAASYATNLSYINESLFDTAFAFYCSYVLKHSNNLQLFDYVPWSEDRVVGTLIENYGWELASDTSATWRIGDGTAAFYNYVYYTVAGFTEADAMRSNQIRDGALTRERAMALVEDENRPRWESLDWYARTVGFSLSEALQVIAAMPKLFDREDRRRSH
jgi:glutamine---fructose-6-phosphate transaminase (isomerizing)